jgi:tetratricopeptide (TPR) repeat protein
VAFSIIWHTGGSNRGDKDLNGKKIKVRKKDSERADEFFGKTSVLTNWVKGHRQLTVAVVAGVAVILLAAWGYNWYSQSRELAAVKAYTQALDSAPGGADAGAVLSDDSLRKLTNIAEKYKSGKIAVLAEMDLGRACYAKGDYQKALGWFQTATSHLDKKSFLSLLATYHEALCYREMGKIPEAIEHLEAIQGQMPANLKREFHWQAALTYELAKDFRKAADNYQRALEAEGSFPSKALIEERMLTDQREVGAAGSKS